MTEDQIRRDIVEVGRRLWEREYVASNDGNISVRLDDRRLITTPKNVSKGFMTTDMMVVVDLGGRKISGEREASSELKMHLQVYRDRPDVRAVARAPVVSRRWMPWPTATSRRASRCYDPVPASCPPTSRSRRIRC